jgi:REP element-mobilizing transposase RayT
MTRPLRLQVAGGTYHVTARGNRRQSIFVDDDDRQAYLQTLARVQRRHHWQVLSFCLMPNHVHLLVQTPVPNLSLGMQLLNGSYGQAFNRRHAGDGHVWQGRFHSRLVQVERYLREVMRYIALNPVRANLAAKPEDWAWSSYPALTGLVDPPRFLATDQALAWFGGTPATFRDFVRAGDATAELDGDGVILGDDAFARLHLPEERPGPDIAARDWAQARPPLRDILRDRDVDTAIERANRAFGYRIHEIAGALDVHPSTVSKRLRRHEEAQGDFRV